MAQTPSTVDQTESPPLTLKIKSVGLTDEQFYHLCQANPDLRFEINAQGELVIMPPTGWITGRRNSRLTRRLDEWAEKDGTGVAFDSSTMFMLPNGAKRSPDASWVRQDRLDSLNEEEKDGFAPICQDFVAELRSRTDSLATLQSKMEEYIENGARLGWLIDPKNRRVFIYRPGHAAETLESPEIISGDPVLPGFALNLQEIW